MVFVAGALAACAWTPIGRTLNLDQVIAWLAPYRHVWYALPLVVAIYIALGLALVPVLLLIAATGIAFGPWRLAVRDGWMRSGAGAMLRIRRCLVKAAAALREPVANTIIAPGRNCWRADRAERFYCIQDAAAYFRLVRDALLKARHAIFILGWDTTASVDLVPGGKAAAAPSRLDKVLRHAARRRPDLQCYILIWDYGSLYTLRARSVFALRFGWRTPRNVQVRLRRSASGGWHLTIRRSSS